MATSNFGTTNFNLPLIAFAMSGSEEIEEAEADFTCEEAEHMVKELNKELTYMEVFIEGGYYEGAMFNAKDTCGYLDIEGGDLETLDDEDAKYFYGDTAEAVKEDYKKDLEKINEFLKDYKENWGGLELQRVAQFSNGETFYKAI